MREIIVNSFAHASYDNLPEIEINIHPKKIEIYNPGSFPSGLTPFDFINRNLPSYKRNRLILDVLFRSKDVEKSGTGFQRVNELCNKNGVEWGYRIEGAGFFFDFTRANDNGSDIARLENDTLNQENDTLKLSAVDGVVFNILKENPHIKIADIAAKVGKSELTIKRALASLQQKKLISRVGSRKTGYWQVL